jgi:putative effector of murein hydrolase LrgA (UPF0299 family)
MANTPFGILSVRLLFLLHLQLVVKYRDVQDVPLLLLDSLPLMLMPYPHLLKGVTEVTCTKYCWVQLLEHLSNIWFGTVPIRYGGLSSIYP